MKAFLLLSIVSFFSIFSQSLSLSRSHVCVRMCYDNCFLLGPSFLLLRLIDTVFHLRRVILPPSVQVVVLAPRKRSALLTESPLFLFFRRSIHPKTSPISIYRIQSFSSAHSTRNFLSLKWQTSSLNRSASYHYRTPLYLFSSTINKDFLKRVQNTGYIFIMREGSLQWDQSSLRLDALEEQLGRNIESFSRSSGKPLKAESAVSILEA